MGPWIGAGRGTMINDALLRMAGHRSGRHPRPTRCVRRSHAEVARGTERRRPLLLVANAAPPPLFRASKEQPHLLRCHLSRVCDEPMARRGLDSGRHPASRLGVADPRRCSLPHLSAWLPAATGSAPVAGPRRFPGVVAGVTRPYPSRRGTTASVRHHRQRCGCSRPVSCATEARRDPHGAIGLRPRQRWRLGSSCRSSSRLRRHPPHRNRAADAAGRPRSGSSSAGDSARRSRRCRSPATLASFHAGRPPWNKGMHHPADPPTVEEVVAVMVPPARPCTGGACGV
jgi:hypothetical protein